MSNIINKIAYLLKGDRRYIYYKKLLHNLSLGRKDIVHIQNNLIQKLVCYAYENTKYYKCLLDENHIKPKNIKSLVDLKKIPPLTKKIIRDNIERIKSNDHYSKTLKLITSGGSTGNQAQIYQSSYYLQMQRAASLRNNTILGWFPEDKSVWLWGAPYEHQQVKDSLISKLGILINRRLLLNAYNYSLSDFKIWADNIKNFKPKVVYGYASIILEFSRFLLQKNIKLNSVNIVVSTSEVLQEREVIEQAFNCPVFDQYGCREIPAIAIEYPKGIMHIADDVVAFNLDKDNNFLFTALHSYGFPLINYQVGDQGENQEIINNDSSPFLAIKLKIGRITDNFINNKNKIISSSALSVYISSFNLPILEQQFIQTNFYSFIVNYIPDNNFQEKYYKDVIRKCFSKYFGSDINLSFNCVEKIPKEASGKKLMFKRVFA